MGLFELLPGQIENRCWVFALHCAAHRKHQAVLAVTERVRRRLISPEIPRLLDHLITACHASSQPATRHHSLPRVDRSPDLPRRRPTRHELTGSCRRPTTRLSREPAPVLRRNVQPTRGNATSSSGGCRPTLPWRLRPATPKSTLPSSDHRRKIRATLYGLSTRTKIMRRSHHDSWN